MKRFVLIAAVLTWASGAAAHDSTLASMVMAPGNSTCGTFLKDVEGSKVSKVMYVSYIEGYISAINMRVPGRADFFEHTDQEARYRFVYEHCRNNPLDMFINGIERLTIKAGVPIVRVK